MPVRALRDLRRRPGLLPELRLQVRGRVPRPLLLQVALAEQRQA